MSEREKFKIEAEPEKFNDIGRFAILTSAELGSLANQRFKEVFADYHGIIFDPVSGEPSFSLFFNRGIYGEDEIVGTVPAVSAKGYSSNDAIDRVRKMENLYKNGAKYVATEDLKDVVEKLLLNKYYNKGNPKWGQIIVDYTERTGYNETTTYTKIYGISPERLVSFIYGYKDDEGDTFDYDVKVLGPIGTPFNGKPTNWVLQVSRASYNEVKKLYRNFGCAITDSAINTSVIVR